jgi:sucrose-6F-phosphate phosphohydrolase
MPLKIRREYLNKILNPMTRIKPLNPKDIKLFLACDLDRTVLPNGADPVSPGAMDAFKEIAFRDDVSLAYFTGRSLYLIEEAIQQFDIPFPDVAVGDVGTTMYFCRDGEFLLHHDWIERIGSDWNGYDGSAIHKLLKGIPNMPLQEDSKQNTYKKSYYPPYDADKTFYIDSVQKRLEPKGIHSAVVFSVDEPHEVGLLDILPASATKKHALQYLQEYLGLKHNQIVYAGDSGNDIEPLTSGYQSILVNNARDQVREEVAEIAKKNGVIENIYFAEGGYQKMNGNYTAGILEGLHHFGFID